MKKVLATVLAAGAVVAAGAGVAVADSGNGHNDTAPHSTAPVTALLNGDVSVLDNATIPADVDVPVIGSKTGAYQGANQNAAPQEDGELVSVGEQN